jgi:hypothetical protein
MNQAKQQTMLAMFLEMKECNHRLAEGMQFFQRLILARLAHHRWLCMKAPWLVKAANFFDQLLR